MKPRPARLSKATRRELTLAKNDQVVVAAVVSVSAADLSR